MFLFAGCAEGKAVVMDAAHGGAVLATASAGNGVDIIDFDPARRHLYLPGARSATMTIFAVATNGALRPLGAAPTVHGAHCVTTDGKDAGVRNRPRASGGLPRPAGLSARSLLWLHPLPRRRRLAVAAAFGLPPFLVVTAAAYFYVRFTGNWQLRALFYGTAPVVVALIVKACWNLGKRTLRSDRLAWVFAVVACGITVIVEKELAIMFIVAGLIEGHSSPPVSRRRVLRHDGEAVPLLLQDRAARLRQWPCHRAVSEDASRRSIPLAQQPPVPRFGGDGDDVAGAGGHHRDVRRLLLNGFVGALAATLGIFAGPVLFTVLATPILLRYHKEPHVAGFSRGVGVTVVGVLVGTTYLIGKEAIGDWVTAAVAMVSLLAITFWKKLPEPLVILAGGVVGLLAWPLFSVLLLLGLARALE